MKRKIISFVLSFVFLFTMMPLASFAFETATPKPVTLYFYFPGDEPNDMQAVLDEFHNRTEKTLNITLKFNFIPWSDLGTKTTLLLAAGEDVDSVFDAPWSQMPVMIGKDQYANLDSYFNTNKYPGLKKAFSKDFIDKNKFVDKYNEQHVYGIPFTRSFGSAAGIYIRKDLRLKYGLPEIKSLADLEKYNDTILKKEKGVTPLGIDASNESLASVLSRVDMNQSQKYQPYTLLSGGTYGGAVFDKNGKLAGVMDRTFDNKEVIKKLPAPLNTQDQYRWYKKARDWYVKGYVDKDILNQKNALGLFTAGKLASVYGSGCSSSDTYADVAAKTESALPGAKVEFFALNDDVRNFRKGGVLTDFKAWNFACIPVTSPNINRTMSFFNWLYADQKNHDLFELGIEGKHWIAVGNDQYKLPAGVNPSKNYNFNGFALTWNTNYIRYKTDYPAAMRAIDKYLANPSTYYTSKLAGFSFNSAPVKTQVAKLGQLSFDKGPMGNGVVADWYKRLNDFYDKQNKAGYQKVLDEFEKQLKAFLAKQK